MKKNEIKYLKERGLAEPPKCYCGKPLRFINMVRGYTKYCSATCSNRAPEKKELTRKRVFEKYGVYNISQLDSVKQKKVGKCGGGRGKKWDEQMHQKMKDVMMKLYGVDHPSHMPDYLKKREKTWLRKYGTTHISKLQSVKDSKYEKRMKSLREKNPDIKDAKIIDGAQTYICECPIHGNFQIPSSVYYDRKRFNSTLCTICAPVGSHYVGLEIKIKSILDKYGIRYEPHSNRKLLDGKEIDIFCPEHNIGIECNGVYWHSSKCKEPKYHFDKYIRCKEQNIQLLQLWEDWIITKFDIVESLIMSKFGIYKHRVGARSCQVRTVTNHELNTVLQYHIQGTVKSSVKLGLFYGGELISVMCFGKIRGKIFNHVGTRDEYELLRYCCLPGWQIIGGASKLLSHFIKHAHPTKIVSFSSNDISNGSLYKKLGFQKIKETYGNYWYVSRNSLVRYHRYNFRKTELIKKGYDANKTESQIMDDLPYHKIYDSGTTRWEMNIKKEEPS